MREDEKWDRPEFVKSAEKAAGNYLAMGAVYALIVFFVFGAISPFFLPWVLRNLPIEPNESEISKRATKIVVVVFMTIWTIVSWIFWVEVFSQIN